VDGPRIEIFGYEIQQEFACGRARTFGEFENATDWPAAITVDCRIEEQRQWPIEKGRLPGLRRRALDRTLAVCPLSRSAPWNDYIYGPSSILSTQLSAKAAVPTGAMIFEDFVS